MLLNADKKLAKAPKASSKNQEEELKGGEQTAQLQNDRSETKKTDFFSELANSGKSVTQLMALDDLANGSFGMAETENQEATTQLADKTNTKPNNTGLPSELKTGVEQLSGVSMDDVKVNYNSNKPAQLSAHAYAQGSNIHVASGQEKHVPHEAWHVAQQKKGRVEPTKQLMGSIPVNDDKKLESEADVMGARALQTGRSSTNPIQAKVDKISGQRGGTFQLVQKLNLEGTQSMTSKFKGLFSVFGDTETTHTKLKKEVEKFNAAKTDAEQEKLKPEIIRLGNEWLDKNASKKDDKSEDRNEKTKRISIEKILKMLEPAPSAEPAPPQAVEDEEATSEALEETPKTQEELGEEEFEENEAEREVYNKDQETKVEEYKKDDDYHSSMPGGFIGVMKGKLVDVVKDVQDTEGSLHQADNFINGDAAVNTFFANALSKAKTDEEKQKVNTHADTVYRGAFKGKVMNKKKKELLDGPIQAYKTSSLAAAKMNKRRIQETAADRVIVEMYYNQLEKLKDGEHTPENNKKAADIYKFAKARKFEVTKRRDKAVELSDKLVEEERVNSKTWNIITSIGYGAAGAAFKIVTLGMGNMKKNLDKRGFNSKEDFTLDTDTEEVTHEEFQSTAGIFDLQGPLAQMQSISGEFNAKMEARKGMGTMGGVFSALSLGLEAGKKFLGFVRGIFSSLGIWSALLATVAPPMAAVAAWCGTISYWIGIVMSSITVLRGLLNGVAQVMNDNPALFSELAGESKKSAVDTFTEAGSFAVGTVGINIAREKITGQDKFNADALIDPSKMVSSKLNPGEGPGTLSNTWLQDKSTQAGGILAADALVGGAANVGLVNADKSMSNNDMKYTQSVNKNRRIGKEGKKKASAGSAETALIEESYETTKAKAIVSGAKLIPLVKKFASEKAPTAAAAGDKVNEKDKENASLVPAVSDTVTDVASQINAGLEEVVKS